MKILFIKYYKKLIKVNGEEPGVKFRNKKFLGKQFVLEDQKGNKAVVTPRDAKMEQWGCCQIGKNQVVYITNTNETELLTL